MVSHRADLAIRAFAEGAIDYFTMPVTKVRFDLAMARAVIGWVVYQLNAAL